MNTRMYYRGNIFPSFRSCHTSSADHSVMNGQHCLPSVGWSCGCRQSASLVVDSCDRGRAGYLTQPDWHRRSICQTLLSSSRSSFLAILLDQWELAACSVLQACRSLSVAAGLTPVGMYRRVTGEKRAHHYSVDLRLPWMSCALRRYQGRDCCVSTEILLGLPSRDTVLVAKLSTARSSAKAGASILQAFRLLHLGALLRTMMRLEAERRSTVLSLRVGAR